MEQLSSVDLPVMIVNMNEAESRERVGQLVREQRLQLRKSVPEFAESIDIDVKTLRSLEAGERWPREVTRRKIEQGLGWPVDSLQHALETGNAPEPAELDAHGRYKEQVRDHVYGAFETSAERIRQKLAQGTDSKDIAAQMVNLTTAVRQAFTCVRLAMDLEAAPEEADRFIDGAMGLLITSGALQAAGFTGQSDDILNEFGAAKELIRASRDRRSPASQDEYELAGGDVAYRRGMTEERRRRMVEKEPEDIPDADGPEHGA